MIDIRSLCSLEAHMVQYLPEVYTVKSAPYHAEMANCLTDWSQIGVAIDAHRGSTKSTRMSRGLLSYAVICRDETGAYRFNKVYLICRTGGPGSLSAQWMRHLQSLVTGTSPSQRLYQTDFGLKRGKKWNEDFCQIERPDGSVFEIHALGKGSSIRGARDAKALILLDDLQNAEDQQSAVVLASDELWLIQDVLPVLLPGQPIRIIGQNLSPESLMSRIELMPSFDYYRFPLETPVGSGHSAWPEMYPDAWIAEKKLDMGIDPFNAEYDCVPRVSGNPIFRKEWFKMYDSTSDAFRSIRNGYVYTVSGFDGADSKADTACETALITFTATADPNPDIYLRRVFHGHLSLNEGVDEMFAAAKEIQTHCTVVESRVKKDNKGPYEEAIKAQTKILGRRINEDIVVPIHDKVTRAYYVQGTVQAGKVFYDPRIKEHVEFVTQMCMFTGTQKFPADMVDAAVHALTEIKDHAGRRVEAPKGKAVLPQGSRLQVMRRAG